DAEARQCEKRSVARGTRAAAASAASRASPVPKSDCGALRRSTRPLREMVQPAETAQRVKFQLRLAEHRPHQLSRIRGQRFLVRVSASEKVEFLQAGIQTMPDRVIQGHRA